MRRLVLGSLLLLAVFATPASAQSVTCRTSNGLRSVDQMADELRAAGYGGPWAVDSIVAAYMRTTGGGAVSCGPIAAPTVPSVQQQRTLVVFIGGLSSTAAGTRQNFSMLFDELTANGGFRADDAVTFSYSPSSAAEYTAPDTCQGSVQSRELLANALRWYRDSGTATGAVLVGHSWGGSVALDSLLNDRDLSVDGRPFIRKVVTIDSPIMGIPANRVALAQRFGMVPTVNCLALGVLAARKAEGVVWESIVRDGVAAATARGVSVRTVVNTVDCVYGGCDPFTANMTSDQGIPGLPVNLVVSLPALGVGNHSAALYDQLTVRQIASFIGPQAPG